MQETGVQSPGGGNGNPLQYSCLENPMDRGAWWATVPGVTKSRTQQSKHTHFTKKENIPRVAKTFLNVSVKVLLEEISILIGKLNKITLTKVDEHHPIY